MSKSRARWQAISLQSVLVFTSGAAVGVWFTYLAEPQFKIVAGNDESNSNLIIVSRFDGKSIRTVIPTKSLTALKWNPESGKPPIEFPQAYVAAKVGLRSVLAPGKFDDWEVTNISLLPTSDGSWFWMVVFEKAANALQGGHSGPLSSSINIVVTMNGDVVTPIDN